jgi:hypothetical protein
MEHPKFKSEQKVSLSSKLSEKCGDTKAHIVTVYSPSQKKTFSADYRIILSNGNEFDVKESELKVA